MNAAIHHLVGNDKCMREGQKLGSQSTISMVPSLVQSDSAAGWLDASVCLSMEF